MNFELKRALVEKFGTQIVASRRLNIREAKLSYLVRGHAEPNPREREALRRALKADFFAGEHR